MPQERVPQSFSHEPQQEHEITLYAGDDHHPVSMTCYDQERFYINGLRAQLDTVEEETIRFAVRVETKQDGWITRRYDLTGEEFYHLLHGNEPVGRAYIGMLEAATRLGTSPIATSTQEHEQRTSPRTGNPIR